MVSGRRRQRAAGRRAGQRAETGVQGAFIVRAGQAGARACADRRRQGAMTMRGSARAGWGMGSRCSQATGARGQGESPSCNTGVRSQTGGPVCKLGVCPARPGAGGGGQHPPLRPVPATSIQESAKSQHPHPRLPAAGNHSGPGSAPPPGPCLPRPFQGSLPPPRNTLCPSHRTEGPSA